ncbi:MAG: hypothetical protein R2813_02060 [Flavobacteriales bacterium]
MKRGVILLFVLVSTLAFGQRNVRDSTIRIFSLSPHIGLQYPFEDLAERFGHGGIVGGSLMYKTKSNWTFDAFYGFIFGNNVKEDSILKPALVTGGLVLNNNGDLLDVFLFERGFLAGGNIGKVFSVLGPNPNSGLHLKVGAGLMQHKIKIQEASQSAYHVIGDYAKGYDRLSNGFMLSQSLGYSHFSNYKLVNYYIGVELFEGFTENRRTVNYDTGMHDGRQRFDIVGSFVFRWYIPIYKRQPQDFYFY